jgi:hypothetical protein
MGAVLTTIAQVRDQDFTKSESTSFLKKRSFANPVGLNRRSQPAGQAIQGCTHTAHFSQVGIRCQPDL